jgi:hypothetical protein
MIDRVEERFDLKPQRLIGDTAYGTAAMLNWLVNEKQIEPHVPVWDRTERDDGAFSRSEFVFDAQANRYTCPAGKFLIPTWRMRRRNPNMYREPARLSGLSVEIEVLSQHTSSPNRAQPPSSRLARSPASSVELVATGNHARIGRRLKCSSRT